MSEKVGPGIEYTVLPYIEEDQKIPAAVQFQNQLLNTTFITTRSLEASQEGSSWARLTKWSTRTSPSIIGTTILWLDESKIKLFGYAHQQRVWGQNGTAFKGKHLTAMVRFTGGSLTFLCCFVATRIPVPGYFSPNPGCLYLEVMPIDRAFSKMMSQTLFVLSLC